MESAKKSFSDFASIQNEIEEIVELAQLEKEEEILIEIEKIYFSTMAKYKDKIAEKQQRDDENGPIQIPIQAPVARNKVVNRLPVIKLPTFDGTVSDWHTFWDMFVSLIHNEMGLDNIQKFHYLR